MSAYSRHATPRISIKTGSLANLNQVTQPEPSCSRPTPVHSRTNSTGSSIKLASQGNSPKSQRLTVGYESPRLPGSLPSVHRWNDNSTWSQNKDRQNNINNNTALRSESKMGLSDHWSVLAYVHYFIVKLKLKVRQQHEAIKMELKRHGSERSARSTVAGQSLQRSPSLRLGFTRQLAFGPWMPSNDKPPLKIMALDRTQKCTVFWLVMFFILVVLLLLFWSQEQEMDEKLREKFGWKSSSTIRPNRLNIDDENNNTTR